MRLSNALDHMASKQLSHVSNPVLTISKTFVYVFKITPIQMLYNFSTAFYLEIRTKAIH